MNLFREIKERKIRKWLAIYTSIIITLIGMVQLFSSRYRLPDFIFNVTLIIALCGFLTISISAWFHGKEGVQKIRKIEIILHSLILIIAIVFISIFGFPETDIYYHPIEKHSVAVLPFKNFSDFKDNDYFSDGITEDILTNLSKIHGLKVTSQSSIMKFKGSDASIDDIANELGVETILEGSVRQYGTKVRITGELIDAATHKSIWADSYDRELKDIFLIQSEVAKKIAAALQQKLSPEEKQQIEIQPTQNIEAYALYLRGRGFYNLYTKDKNENAIEYFKKAIKLDSNYALAYAGLSDAYIQKNIKFWEPRSWVDSAKVMAEKSIKINPGLAEGFKALGLVFDIKKDYDNALYNYHKAIEINPNFSPAIFNIAAINNSIGKLDDAINFTIKSIKLAPDYTYSYILAGICYETLADTIKSKMWFDKALNLEPDNLFNLMWLGWHYLMGNNMKMAQNISDSLMKLDPDLPFGIDFTAELFVLNKKYKQAGDLYLKYYKIINSPPDHQLGYIYKKLGKNKQAEKILNDQMLSGAEQIAGGRADQSIFLEQAYDYSILGKTDDALKFLQISIDKGYRDFRWLRKDPMLEDIRTNGKFEEIVDSLEKMDYAMRKNVE